MVRVVLEPRVQKSNYIQLLVPVLSVMLTLLAGTLMFWLLDKSPPEALYSFFIEPFTTSYGIGEILLKMAPLLLIAQGLAIGFRAKVFNIGAEGQLVIGAICAGILAIQFNETDSWLLLPAMVVAGAVGGMLWASIAAVLRTRFNTNEILVTLMLSSVALQLLYYLVTGPLRDPNGFNFPQSISFSDAAMFGLLFDGARVNTSLLLGLVATLIAWFFVQHSLRGYKLMVGGMAPSAARYAGFSEKSSIWIGLLAGGAAAGIAGVAEVAGPVGVLQRNISSGYGFAAITVAYLGALHPLGILFASLLMAVIYVGGDMALVSVQIPTASSTVFQGLLLSFYLGCSLLVNYRFRVIQTRTEAGAPLVLSTMKREV